MKLSIALATLFLAAATTLPAFAQAQTGRNSYQRDTARSDAVRQWNRYRNGYQAYAAAPRARQPADNTRQPANNSWNGDCVARSGAASETYSAYPSWNVC